MTADEFVDALLADTDLGVVEIMGADVTDTGTVWEFDLGRRAS